MGNDSRRRFVIIHQALEKLEDRGNSTDAQLIKTAEDVRIKLLVSYGLTPLTPKNGDDQNMLEIFDRELVYAEDFLSGAGRESQSLSGRIEKILDGEPVGLEALIDIEYGFGWEKKEVGPPWMMGDWRTMARLVRTICELGRSSDHDNATGMFNPERVLKLWPVSLDEEGVPKWEDKQVLNMQSGKDGYYTSATLGAEVSHVMCKNSGIDAPRKEKCKEDDGGDCKKKVKFRGRIELQTFGGDFKGKEWISLIEGPQIIMSYSNKQGGYKVPRFLWKGIRNDPISFSNSESSQDIVRETEEYLRRKLRKRMDILRTMPDEESREWSERMESTIDKLYATPSQENPGKIGSYWKAGEEIVGYDKDDKKRILGREIEWNGFTPTSKAKIRFESSTISLDSVRESLQWGTMRRRCVLGHQAETKFPMWRTDQIMTLDGVDRAINSDREEREKLTEMLSRGARMYYCPDCKGVYWRDQTSKTNKHWFFADENDVEEVMARV